MPTFYHADSTPLTKQCTKCYQIKPIDEFYKTTHNRLSTRCKECISAINKHRRLLKNTALAIQQPLFVLSRVCTQCHIEKPVEMFNRCSDNPTGYQSQCKDCMYYKYSPVKDPRYRRGTNYVPPTEKTCITCHLVKPLDAFPRKSEHKDGRDSQCKTCRSNYERQRRLDNPEWARAQDRRPRVRTEKDRERHQRAHAIRSLNPAWVEQRRTYGRAWTKANPLKLLERSRRRVAFVKLATVGKVSYECILERDGSWCYICGKDILPHHVLSFDHYIPIIPLRGSGRTPGPHTEENIHPTHDICNYRKGNRLLEEMTPFQRRGPDN